MIRQIDWSWKGKFSRSRIHLFGLILQIGENHFCHHQYCWGNKPWMYKTKVYGEHLGDYFLQFFFNKRIWVLSYIKHGFLKCLFISERRGEREHEQRRGRDRERESQAGCAVKAEPHMGIQSHKAWDTDLSQNQESGHLTDWATQTLPNTALFKWTIDCFIITQIHLIKLQAFITFSNRVCMI